ncbi:MAG: polyprenyl synthetase family protein [Desulfobacterota bacterium]|nr:polyprenyl synthetase family protein [Thermodesulfobacteriota bacterium]
MNLQSYLNEKRLLVENCLREIFVSLKDVPAILKESMEYMLFSEGKKIRPILAIATCESLGKPIDKLLPFACAIEMIHTYSLIHDDLPSIDNDDIRRGKPTCHKVFGEAVAILAGDALLTEAFRIMSDNRFTEDVNPKTVKRIIFEIAQAAGAEGMVGGQILDVMYDGQEGSKSIVDYIHWHKTCALIRASVRVGAIMGGAKKKELKALTRYGECVGLAFQIVDDILDFEGDEGLVGKRLKKDTAKQTYVKHYGITTSKLKVEKLIEEAIESLSFMGERGKILRELAFYIGRRTF